MTQKKRLNGAETMTFAIVFFAPVPRSIFSRIFFSFQFQFAVTSGAVQTGIQIIIYREKAET